MQVSHYEEAFNQINFVFLDLEKHLVHLAFRLLDEKNNTNEVLPPAGKERLWIYWIMKQINLILT